MVQVEELPQWRDPRGTTFEPVDAAVLACARNVHVVLNAPGHVRGNHVHHRGTEWLVVSGPALVAWELQGERVTHEVPADVVMRFTFPAGVPHAVHNRGEQTMVLVSFGTEPYDPSNTSPHPLLPFFAPPPP